MSRHVTFNTFFVAQETRVRRGLQHPKFRVCLSHLKAKALHMLNFVQISVMSCKTLEIHGPQVHREVYCERCVVSRAFLPDDRAAPWRTRNVGTGNGLCGEGLIERVQVYLGRSFVGSFEVYVIMFVCTYFSFLTPRPCVLISN